jgi:hypothetical protein
MEKKRGWIAPSGILITIVVALVTSTFRDKFGLDGATWRAIFILSGIISIGWLIRSIKEAWKSEKLADIVGQTSPQGFNPNLYQTTQTKLPQAKLLFDPSMGKFRNLRPLLINLPRRLAGHLLPMSPHFRGSSLRTNERL